MDIVNIPKKRAYRPKPISSKLAKYAKAVAEGKTKTEAKTIAGYAPSTRTTDIDSTNNYQTISMKNELLKVITPDTLAKELNKNIVQDDDKGAKNTAIKMAMDRFDPADRPDTTPDKVVIMLKETKETIYTQAQPPQS